MSKPRTGTRNTRRSSRSRGFCQNVARSLCALALLLPLQAATLTGLDPAFTKYPLDKWLAEPPQPRLRWHVEFTPAELSTHQRLMTRVVTRIDGRELNKRRGEGDFLVLLQYRDAGGKLWQHHGGLDLGRLQPGIQGSDIDLTIFAFILPGDYTATVAVIDTRTGDHNVVQRKFHVAPLKTDPLPDAWTGLPAVEFIAPTTDPPDVWYLPDIENRLHLTLRTQRPVHLQVLVNTTPTERAAGSAYALRRNMSLLIPALKILSRIDLPNGVTDTAFLDLTHRRVPFEQKDIHQPDWDLARQFFLKLNPGIIDVRALEGQWRMRKFFWDQVASRLTPKGPEIPVVIVLSGPAFFEDQEPVDPRPAAAGDSRLFYIRYRTVPVRPRTRPRPGMRPPPPPLAFSSMPVDDLEHTVEPLGARLFDVVNTEQFRRVLAAILDQIAQL